MSLWRIDSHITETLKKLPNKPGVYLFRACEKGVSGDAPIDTPIDTPKRGEVLYVGRATSLRSRVTSYFSGRDSRGERIFQMVKRATMLETIETETVLESVILEANLIKKYSPKYNVDLKDDKSFSYFAITKEEFPRILMVREREVYARENRKLNIQEKREENQLYSRVYGPYLSKRHMETVLKILRKIFPFHSNSQKSEKGCLHRQIGLCPGPYDGGITREAYRKNIRNIEYVLRGQKKRLLTTLEREMRTASKRENFEMAKMFRDQLFAMRHIRDIALLTNDQRLITDNGESECESRRGSLVARRRSLRIEAYDISNISGEHAVASMVVFENGESNKSEYRKFKIKSVKGANDIAMMREVLARRVRHTEWSTPDLIILDGGKGHLNMAVGLWEALDIAIPLVAVAKGPTRKKVDIYTDSRFLPDSALLANINLLEHIREEAHRFAITYHRKLRGKQFLSFVKEEIE